MGFDGKLGARRDSAEADALGRVEAASDNKGVPDCRTLKGVTILSMQGERLKIVVGG